MIVEAEKFILKDSNGQRQAMLDSTESGPMLTLYDSEGTVRVALGIKEYGPVMAFFGEDGTMRVSVVARESTALQLHDKQGHPRAIVNLTGEQTSFSHLNEDGVERASFRFSENGPALHFYDTDINTRLTLGVRDDGEPILGLLDANGNPVFLPYDPK